MPPSFRCALPFGQALGSQPLPAGAVHAGVAFHANAPNLLEPAQLLVATGHGASFPYRWERAPSRRDPERRRVWLPGVPPFCIVGLCCFTPGGVGACQAVASPGAEGRRFMHTQPPLDQSALMREIDELKDQVARMRVELDFLLDKNPLEGHYHARKPCQEEIGGQMQALLTKYQDYGRDKNNPPVVPNDTLLQCVRCGRKWVPHAKRPKKCPTCKAPWWFLPKWRWRNNEMPKEI